MKIIAIVGSPHGAGGSTARLTRLVLEGAESAGALAAGKEAGPVLTLSKAVSVALSHNRNVISGRLEVEKAGQQVLAGRKRFFPVFDLKIVPWEGAVVTTSGRYGKGEPRNRSMVHGSEAREDSAYGYGFEVSANLRGSP